MAMTDGSSPRERGTQQTEAVRYLPIRIIPARAGNTYEAGRNASCLSDHPRASGEHGGERPAEAWDTGSSPRERGTPAPRNRESPGQRIIPARAGNTLGGNQSLRLEPDHPRASGEHEVWLCEGYATGGSSPRERGTPRLPKTPGQFVRIIPARAGKGPPRLCQSWRKETASRVSSSSRYGRSSRKLWRRRSAMSWVAATTSADTQDKAATETARASPVRGAKKRLPRMRCEARSRSGPSATPRGRRSSGASLRSGRTPSRPRLAALRSKIKGERRRTGCPASVPRGGNFQTLERGQFSSVDKNVNSR